MTKLRKARPETATIPATPAPSSVRSAASEASPASGSPTATFGRRRHPPSAAAALSASPGAATIQLSVAARPVTAVSSPASALLEEWEQPHRPIAASGAVEPWPASESSSAGASAPASPSSQRFYRTRVASASTLASQESATAPSTSSSAALAKLRSKLDADQAARAEAKASSGKLRKRGPAHASVMHVREHSLELPSPLEPVSVEELPAPSDVSHQADGAAATSPVEVHVPPAAPLPRPAPVRRAPSPTPRSRSPPVSVSAYVWQLATAPATTGARLATRLLLPVAATAERWLQAEHLATLQGVVPALRRAEPPPDGQGGSVRRKGRAARPPDASSAAALVRQVLELWLGVTLALLLVAKALFELSLARVTGRNLARV